MISQKWPKIREKKQTRVSLLKIIGNLGASRFLRSLRFLGSLGFEIWASFFAAEAVHAFGEAAFLHEIFAQLL